MIFGQSSGDSSSLLCALLWGQCSRDWPISFQDGSLTWFLAENSGRWRVRDRGTSPWAAWASLQHGGEFPGVSILTEQAEVPGIFVTNSEVTLISHTVLVKAAIKACPDLRGGDTVQTVLIEGVARFSKSNAGQEI